MNQISHSASLLKAFDTTSLGEGDASVGANLLASMAITLANLTRPGSGIKSSGSKVTPVGCSLLVNGSLNASLIADEVTSRAGQCQQNILENLGRLLEDNTAEQEHAGSKGARRWKLNENAVKSPGENSLFQLMTDKTGSNPLFGTRETLWQDVATCRPSPRLHDLLKRPLAFVVANTPGNLEKQLDRAHMGHVYAALELNRPAVVTTFGDLCPALMDGMLPAGPNGMPVQARLLVSDGGHILQDCANSAAENISWLGRLVWLVEGSAGPSFQPESTADTAIAALDDLPERFERCIGQVFANRFETHGASPMTCEFDFRAHQASWMQFLNKMEESLPGIRGVARHLFSSLTFGLMQLSKAKHLPKGFSYTIAGIHEFASQLVHRMANARNAIIADGRQFWRHELEVKALVRLNHEAMDTRSLYRALRITASECEDLVERLQSRGAIRAKEGRWESVNTPRQISTRGQLQLEA